MPFKVPSTTKYVTFDYLVGNVNDPAHRVPLYVQVLSGINFVTDGGPPSHQQRYEHHCDVAQAHLPR